MYSVPGQTQVSQCILWVSSTSQACSDCTNAIMSQQLTRGLVYKIVRLDTAKDREAAKTGMHIQITAVPTMVVEFSDGNVQVIPGTPRIVAFLTSFQKALVGPQHEEQEKEPEVESVKKKKGKSDKKKKKHTKKERDDTRQVKFADSNEEEEEEERVQIPKGAPKVRNGTSNNYAKQNGSVKSQQMASLRDAAKEMAAQREEMLKQFGGE